VGRNEPRANIHKLLQDWLRDEKNGKWRLILDNVDDDHFLHEAPPANQHGSGSGQISLSRQPLLEYLPHSQNGSILITTRSRKVALRLVEQSDIIAVEPMDEAHAVALLEKKLGQRGGSKNIAELAVALEFMPLAIVQAAAYVSQRVPRYSVQQYLEEFRRSDRKKTSLLNHDGGHLRRDWEAKNYIMATWQISFEYISKERPSAADLLSLMSFFDRQGIPETLIRYSNIEQNHKNMEGADVDDEDNNEDNLSESTGDDGFEDDILTLRNYSFISANTDKTTFEMHRLVQLATRAWLNAHGQLERWKRQFVKNLAVEFPIGEYENWERCQSLFPHAKSAVSQRPDEKDSLREWASLLHNAAWYALGRGYMNDTEEMSLQAMKARKKLFGQEYKETLSSMVILASTYWSLGRWKEAEQLFVQVVDTGKRVLGAEHPDTLTSMANLASTYRNQGRWKEAEQLFVQVVDTWKRVLGAEHPDTLTSMANLASTYRSQGQWKEAEQLEVQVVGTRKRVLGAEHPDTLTSIANLVSTYLNQGRWDKAEQLSVQVLDTRKRVLGAEHPDALTSMSNLAFTWKSQGRWKEAEQLFVQVVDTGKRVLGAEHPDTLTSMANLASTYWNQGRWKEAEQLEVRVVGSRKRVLGVDHPYTLASMANLASTSWSLGRWKEAEQLFVQVLETRKRVLGAEHPDTLTSKANLASTYRNQRRWKEAEHLSVQVLETRKRVLGAEHPDTLTSMSNLASTYWSQGRWKEAEQLFVQVLRRERGCLGQSIQTR
jgi:tetratricopeptide (TPR) repeat protein